jgi:hypothetical protein
MTRIGRYQFWFPDFTGNASYRRDNLAPLKILPDQTASVNISVPMLPGAVLECIPERRVIHKPFF